MQALVKDFPHPAATSGGKSGTQLQFKRDSVAARRKLRSMELRDKPQPFPPTEQELPEPPRCGLEELPPPDVFDPVIEAYKKDIDRTLLIENLKLTPAQ